MDHDRIDVDAAVPDIEMRHRGVPGHHHPIDGDGLERRVGARRLGEPCLASGEDDTGAEPLDIPFPGAGNRLVEVVHIEEEIAFGRGGETEVLEMRVATGLHDETGDRSGGEVSGHDRRRTAEEGEG